jgi:hypothetical protein
MSGNSSDIDTSVKERVINPILLPIISIIATVLLIVLIGETLLATVGYSWVILGETIVLATPVALLLTIIVGGIASVAAKVLAPDEE